MLQAYEGYLEKGKVYPLGSLLNIQGRRRVVITILDEPARNDETIQRLTALDKFFSEIESSNEDVPEFERVKFREVEI